MCVATIKQVLSLFREASGGLGWHSTCVLLWFSVVPKSVMFLFIGFFLLLFIYLFFAFQFQ